MAIVWGRREKGVVVGINDADKATSGRKPFTVGIEIA